MFVWDYEIIVESDDNVTVQLSMAKFDKGKTYKVVKVCRTVEKVLFWLKHFERLDLESFKLYANVTADLEKSKLVSEPA